MGDLPDCTQASQPIVVAPISPTPKLLLHLSDLDDQKFLRFTIKYIFVFEKAVPTERLKDSLSRVLVDYYPLAGRLRRSKENDQKLEVDCNGQGAVFVETFMDISCDDFLAVSSKPNKSWRKLLHKVQASSFEDVPPLVLQVTKLRCGGMILCTAISHCICDGIGTSQFLHAWAHFLCNGDALLPVKPTHCRGALRRRDPPHIDFPLPQYQTKPSSLHISEYLKTRQLVPVSVTFSASCILNLKRLCSPPLKCTAFEALAAHTWRSWARSLNLPPSFRLKLLFSVNIRKRMVPELPPSYYGNGFVLACAETAVEKLVDGDNLFHGIKLVQHAKSCLSDNYVRSLVDFLEDNSVTADLSASLVISQWAKLGLEELDFGEGRPLHMGPLISDIYCLFLPVAGGCPDAVRVLLSMPESVAEGYQRYMEQHR